jgi:hypothetical protein
MFIKSIPGRRERSEVGQSQRRCTSRRRRLNLEWPHPAAIKHGAFEDSFLKQSLRLRRKFATTRRVRAYAIVTPTYSLVGA